MAPSGQDEHAARVRRVPPTSAGDIAESTLSFVLAPTWVSASIARERVEAWLQTLRWPIGQTDDLVLAVSEAVSNSVEHGYLVAVHQVDVAGTIEIDGRLTTGPTSYTRQVVLTVRDGGRWREHDDGDGRHRGHGMHIMRGCTATMTITSGPQGTTVELVGKPVPTPS